VTDQAEIKIFIAHGEVTCGECGNDLGRQAWIMLAGAAHVRHAETNYDELLAAGWEREDGRAEVQERVRQVLNEWQTSAPQEIDAHDEGYEEARHRHAHFLEQAPDLGTGGRTSSKRDALHDG